jgi:hypothetical protein
MRVRGGSSVRSWRVDVPLERDRIPHRLSVVLVHLVRTAPAGRCEGRPEQQQTTTTTRNESEELMASLALTAGFRWRRRRRTPRHTTRQHFLTVNQLKNNAGMMPVASSQWPRAARYDTGVSSYYAVKDQTWLTRSRMSCKWEPFKCQNQKGHRYDSIPKQAQ